MTCSVIHFTVIDLTVTLIMGNYFPTPEKVIQDRRESLKDKKKQQGNTQKRKYQDFLDIVLSSQVNISNF